MRIFPRGICSILLAALSIAFLPRAGFGEEVLRATLANGLQVVIVPDHLAPVVTTEVNYLAGSNEAPDGFPGMAHAQEHMMFRGSPGLSANQLSTLIADLGGDFNADTQQTVTQYFFTVPREDLDIALHIESIRMRGVLDQPDLWNQERGAIEQEVAQDLSNPMYVFYSRLLRHIYAGTPYAHDALGTRPSFEKTTGKMLQDFHDKWYAPNNAILVIAGDVDPPQALALVRQLFESIPSRPVPPRPKAQLQPLRPATISLETDLAYGMAVLAYRLPGYNSPDFAAGQVLADVLDSERGDLYALVPEGAALSAGFDIEPTPVAAIGFATAAYPQGGNGQALIERLQKIIAAYRQNGVPAELVAAAKRREIAAAEFARNSIPGLAQLWSQALAVEGRSSPEENIEAIRRVTPEAVNRVAKEYLDNATAVKAILSSRPAGKPTVARPISGKESFAPQEVKSAPLPPWAQRAAAAEITPSVLAPADFHLANGLRVIVQPSTISGTVNVYGRVKNQPDLQVPKGKEGVDLLLGDLFSYGTTTLDRLEFQKALDEIAADESAGTSFSLQVLADHFDRGLQLLADNLLHPALPQQAFRVIRQETVDALAGKLQSPAYLARRALLKGIYPKHDPTLRQATPQTVNGLTLDDVKSYYHQVFRPDLTTVIIIGRITPEEAKQKMEKYFGGWQAKGPKPETDLPPVPVNPPSAHHVPDPSRVQAEVTLSENLGIDRSNPDYYPLQLGSHVLAGAFYATRLYRDLREETGLVYTVEAMLEAGKTRSVFSVFFACDPDNIQRARALVVRDLHAMQTTAVTSRELQQAKTLLIRQIPLSRASFDGIADVWLELVRKDLPLDEPQHAARHYRETTAEQVQAAFAKWLRPGDLVQVITGPEGK